MEELYRSLSPREQMFQDRLLLSKFQHARHRMNPSQTLTGKRFRLGPPDPVLRVQAQVRVHQAHLDLVPAMRVGFLNPRAPKQVN